METKKYIAAILLLVIAVMVGSIVSMASSEAGEENVFFKQGNGVDRWGQLISGTCRDTGDCGPTYLEDYGTKEGYFFVENTDGRIYISNQE